MFYKDMEIYFFLALLIRIFEITVIPAVQFF